MSSCCKTIPQHQCFKFMAKCLTNALGFPRSARSFEVVPWIHTRISSTTMDVFHHGWMWGPILMAPLWDGGHVFHPTMAPLTHHGMRYILRTMTMVDDSHPLCLDYSNVWTEYYSILSWSWYTTFAYNKRNMPFVGLRVIHPNLSHKTLICGL